MKNTKRCFVLFSFYDRTGIEAYLEKQAENEKVPGKDDRIA